MGLWPELLGRETRDKHSSEQRTSIKWKLLPSGVGNQRLDDLRAQPTAGDSLDSALNSGPSRLPASSRFRGVCLF